VPSKSDSESDSESDAAVAPEVVAVAEYSQLLPEVDEDFNQDPLSGLEPL